MNVLLIHPNASVRYQALIRRLGSNPGNRMMVLSRKEERAPGAQLAVYAPNAASDGIGAAVATGEAVLAAAKELKAGGFVPDVMIGTGDTGEILFLKDLWPDVPVLADFEQPYRLPGDGSFDSEFPEETPDEARRRMDNATAVLSLAAGDWGMTGGNWLRDRFPVPLRPRLFTLPAGVDTHYIRPNPRRTLVMPGGSTILTRGDAVVTFTARRLGVHRGFHTFMRALPEVLRRHPHARILVLGDDTRVPSGPRAGESLRETLLAELGGALDRDRLHFLGPASYEHYTAVLQLSGAHVHLAHPALPSVALEEAMAAGCAVVGSRTAPVMELVRDGENGLLADPLSPSHLADRILTVLESPAAMEPMRERARATAVDERDASGICLPRQIKMLEDLAARRSPAPHEAARTEGPDAAIAGVYTIADAYQLGRRAEMEGNQAQAERIYRTILQHRPDTAIVFYRLGLMRYTQKRTGEAVALLQQACALDPANGGYYADQGVMANTLRQQDQRLYNYRRSVRLEPDNALFLMNYGAALQDQGHLDEAKTVCCQAGALSPALHGVYANMANACVKRNAIKDGIRLYRRAVAITPGMPEMEKNLGMCLLLDGAFAEGGRYYEGRLVTEEIMPRHFTVPQWDGTPFHGKTLFLHAEQGMGDTLNFCRYIPMIKALGGRVILETQIQLLPLMQTVEGVDQVVPLGIAPPPFDLFCPLLSLIHVMGTTPDTIPAAIPYLKADPARVRTWAGRLPDRGRPRVGLVWAGSPKHMNDRNRSLSLASLAGFVQTKGIDFYSVQVGPAQADIPALGLGGVLPDLGAQFGDFSDTAAALTHLDLLITVDTSVAHLAGALGRPVWTLLPFAPDWRWMLDREDTPWYPTMRLFRQGEDATWEPVIARVRDELVRMTTHPALAAS